MAYTAGTYGSTGVSDPDVGDTWHVSGQTEEVLECALVTVRDEEALRVQLQLSR